jgi:DeoR family transcriptional regulator of aga operon
LPSRVYRPAQSPGEHSTAVDVEVRAVMADVANQKPLKLLVEERRRRILELLDKEERATVDELADRFDVSTVTIRGDLDTLANGGALVRSHGGALKRLDHGDIRISIKETLNHREKVRIGHAAARLIRQFDTVILDSGTTTAEIAKQLKFLKLESLTVITNGLNIAMHLANLPHVRVIMIGGLLRHMSYSTVGPQAEQLLSGLNADHLFLGVDGLDPDIGLTTPDVLEAQLNSLMIRVSREVTVVADSSKFLQRSLSVIAGVGDVQRIITDHKADSQLVVALRDRGIDVMLV